MRNLLSLILLLTAVTASPWQAGPAAAQVFPDEKVILATNRVRAPGPQTTAAFKAQETGPLTLFRIQRIPAIKTTQTKSLARESLSQELAASGGSGQVLVYIHGFNNTVDDAITLTIDVAGKMRFPGSVAVFSWPSMGTFLPWDYTRDVGIAARSVGALVDLLKALDGAQSVSKVHVLAHSLGNDVLVKALLKYAASSKEGERKLGEVVFCAPDVDRGEFISAFGRIRGLVRGATLWGSNSDFALKLAQGLGRPNRAGLFTSGPLVVQGLDTVDVSAETGLFQPDHDPYRQVSSLFADLEHLLKEQRTPPWDRKERADNYKKVITPAGPYYRFAAVKLAAAKDE
jgi:esterase/lipase superfamily enzyme